MYPVLSSHECVYWYLRSLAYPLSVTLRYMYSVRKTGDMSIKIILLILYVPEVCSTVSTGPISSINCDT